MLSFISKFGKGPSVMKQSVGALKVFLPPASAVEVIETEPFVCLSVCMCLFVSALTAEPFDTWSRNLVEGLTLIISDEFAGQGHRSKVKVTRSKKCHFQDLLI